MLNLDKVNKTAGKGNSVDAKRAAYQRQLAKRSAQNSSTVGRAAPPDAGSEPKPAFNFKKKPFMPSGPR